MERKKVTVKGIEAEAWERLRQMREVEQRFCGAILSDAIMEYWANGYEEVEAGS